MISLPRGLTMTLLAAGAALLPGSNRVSGPLPVSTETPVSAEPSARTPFTELQKEFYMSSDTISYIRPGLNIKINSVTNVASGKKPTVDFTLTDDLGQPLDRNGGLTPGVISLRFVPATWDGRFYTNLLVTSTGTPTRDSAGTFTTIDIGHYTYTFSLALGTVDATKPFTLWAGGRRVLTAIIGKDYWAPPSYLDIVPSTNAPATTWQVTTLAACNQCHDPVTSPAAAPHGGNYRDIKTCALCHNPNNMTGTLADFNGQRWFHAIHSSNTTQVGAITFPTDQRNCVMCHDPAAKGGTTWYSYPSTVACTGCHADVNLTTGANHPAGPATDATCASCHPPVGSNEFDAGIQTAHTVPLKSKQLKGYIVTIVAVDNVGPGKKPLVTFKLTNGDGSIIDPGFFKTSANGSLSVVLGGPTTDYINQPFSENASGATFNGTVAMYQMTNAIPATATGTWAVAIQTRRTVVLNPAPTKGAPASATVSEPPASNAVTYIAVTGGTPIPRRTAVAIANCNTCHNSLPIFFSHGSQRVSIEFCIVCHNPNGSDVARRPASAGNPESISFAHMIHRIHTGDQLTNDFTVYGFSGPTNFNEVTYPGDRKNCLKCHTNAAAFTPPSGTTPVVTQRDYFSPEGSSTAACLGCHDNVDAAAHAYLNTVTAPFFGEACATCHGLGKDWDVAKVHAQ